MTNDVAANCGLMTRETHIKSPAIIALKHFHFEVADDHADGLRPCFDGASQFIAVIVGNDHASGNRLLGIIDIRAVQ